MIGTKADYNLVVAQGDRTVAVTLSRKLAGAEAGQRRGRRRRAGAGQLGPVTG